MIILDRGVNIPRHELNRLSSSGGHCTKQLKRNNQKEMAGKENCSSPRGNPHRRVAVVTGSNKGIGLEIVRSLCRRFGQDGVVYLTARNEGRGRAAVDLLEKDGLDVRFHLLDVTDQSTIDNLRASLEKDHGGIDVLVNNAGIYISKNIPLVDKSVQIMETNFFGLYAVCRSLIPLIRSGGRIVNVSSSGGYTAFRNEMKDVIRDRFRCATTEDNAVDLMNEFLREIKAGTCLRNGWSDDPYDVSKLGVILLSKIHAEMLSQDESRKNVLVNSCCPGLVRTDMTDFLPEKNRFGSKLSVEEGADTPVFLSLLPPGTTEPNGKFVRRRKAYDFITNDVIIPLGGSNR